jgi:hypothetical protein
MDNIVMIDIAASTGTWDVSGHKNPMKFDRLILTAMAIFAVYPARQFVLNEPGIAEIVMNYQSQSRR